MPTANTFSTPTAGKSFTLSLIDFNNSLLSVFSNFYGPTPPSSLEVTVAGVATSPYTGMLYRSSIYNAFYAYDATAKKGGGKVGKLQRVTAQLKELEKEMKELVGKWKKAEGKEKETLLDKLKEKTKVKKELEALEDKLADAIF